MEFSRRALALRVLLTTVCASTALSACAQSDSSASLTDKSDGLAAPWTIAVLEGDGDWYTCVEESDLEIGSSIQSADLPSSHATVTLGESVSHEDAVDLADCIVDRLKSGEVTLEGTSQ